MTSLIPDWHPLKVTRLVWQVIEKRSKAVNQPSASLKLENIGLSCRKIAWVAMWRNDEILLSSTNASRVAPSSRRTRALGKRRLSLVISSPTSGAISSATPTNKGDGASMSGFSRQYFRTEALGA